MNALNPLLLLSTGNLGYGTMEEFPGANIVVDVLPFIETKIRSDDSTRAFVEDLAKREATIAFTSSTAVQAVARFITDDIRWKIYCLDELTKSEVEKHFASAAIIGTAASASRLAEFIVKDRKITNLTFFCGNMRRDELPDILSGHGINVHEFQVYDTIKKPARLDKHYHGILFFSPSAVDAFFTMNTVAGDTILFAIGRSTAEAITTYSTNPVVISDRPNKRQLLKQAADYFTTQNNRSDLG